MATFDLTPKNKVVPGPADWYQTSASLPVADQEPFVIESLRDLSRSYHSRVKPDADNIHRTKWPTDLLQQIYETSYPLRGLFDMKTTVKINKEWLSYWEIYAKSFAESLSKRMKLRSETARKVNTSHLRGVPVRTFHIADNSGNSLQTIQKVINKIEYNTGVQINWEWLATYNNNATPNDRSEHIKNKDRWLAGVDGEGKLVVSNMRAWRNKITTTLKSVDMIIDNSDDTDTKAAGIAFALINLTSGGGAIIHIPKINSTSIASMIYLFSNCFETTEIIHTVADDRMYLRGDGFLDNLTAKHHKHLYDLCEALPGSPNISPFTQKFMSGDDFTDAVDKMLKLNVAINGWRYDYYEKIFKLNNQLTSNASNATFDSYTETFLEDKYTDETEKWVAATGFNFFADGK